jgi:hypothetical protein
MRHLKPIPARQLARCALVGAIALTSPFARAQTLPASLPSTGPSTAPTTAPVTVNLSTPRASVHTFAKALDVGDAAAMRAAMYAGGDVDRRMVDATIEMALAMASFRQAAVAMFGKAEADRALDDPDARLATALQRIETAEEKITADTATLGQPSEPPVLLRRTDGRWQVVIGALTASDSNAAVAERVGGISRQAAVLNAFAEDIRADKHRSMREVLTLVHGQMMKAALEPTEEPPPATLPAPGEPAGTRAE